MTVGGCSSLISQPGGFVKIRNYSAVERSVSVKISKKDDGEIVFQEDVSIDGEERIEYQNAFNGGEYSANVEIEEFGKKSFDLSVGNCSDIPFQVLIDSDRFGLSQGYCG
ncbi:hypothetical protein [Halomicrobium zhouii]|uniref:hypothetical protein n=1 Tax=Halomicrobium zhouii TaxID=767519 RepID=UPI0011607BD5|nr:hypothetical protein [Halomicrobium zhouii]